MTPYWILVAVTAFLVLIAPGLLILVWFRKYADLSERMNAETGINSGSRGSLLFTALGAIAAGAYVVYGAFTRIPWLSDGEIPLRALGTMERGYIAGWAIVIGTGIVILIAAVIVIRALRVRSTWVRGKDMASARVWFSVIVCGFLILGCVLLLGAGLVVLSY